jgi:membrane-bound metal-dependent hydrolase YbcI (DUF457 family)
VKWINHQMIGFGTGYLLTGELSSAAVASVAAVIPDAIERIGALIGRVKHRKVTHNLFPWLMILMSFLIIAYFAAGETLSNYAIIFLMGLVTHLICDALTVTGIPISRNGEMRITLKLFPAGHIIEYLVAVVFLVFCFREYLIFLLDAGKAHINNPVELINPLAYIQKGEYIHLWNTLYELFFRGFMARFFATAFLLGALWFGFYRQNFVVAIVLFSLTIVICYLGSVVGAAFWYLK